MTEARRYAADAVADLPRVVVESVGLAVSELATNCVRYAGTDYTVKIDVTPDRVRVEVADEGDGIPTMRSPAASEPSGRGLLLVRRLTDDWGVEAAVGKPGKSVWFTVPLSSTPGAALQDAG